MVLPDANKGDLFFDFEGDPLWTRRRPRVGTGIPVGRARPPPTSSTRYWAHDRASERQALVDFLAMVRKRRKRYPDMHVYHYAAYEKSTLLRLAGRYGVGEDDVDDLLRNGVLVDLYPVGAQEHSGRHRELQHQVPRAALHGQRAAQRRGHHGHRLDHAVRPLLRAARRGPRRRGGDRAQGDRGLQPLRLPVDAPAARLADGAGHRIRGPAARPAAGARRRQTGRDPPTTLERTLLQFAGDGIEERTAEQTAVAMVAAARGFHKREDKPFWWAHFDRVNNPVDEWADNSDVFIAERAEIVADWHQPPRARKPQRHVRLIGEIANGDLGGEHVRAVRPARTHRPRRRPGPAGVRLGRRCVECDNPEAPTEVVIVRDAAQGRRRLRPAARSP